MVPEGGVGEKLLAWRVESAGGEGREEKGLKGFLEEDVVGVRVGVLVGGGDGMDGFVDLRFFFFRARPRKPILEVGCCWG